MERQTRTDAPSPEEGTHAECSGGRIRMQAPIRGQKEEPSEGGGVDSHEPQGPVNSVLLTRNASGFNPGY